MPPRAMSRHQFSIGLTDTKGRLYLSDPEPYRFQSFPDNRQHVVKDGDTLQGLAARFFPDEDAALLWWAIAWFQPDPILDPTLALEAGSTLVIPGPSALRAIFSPLRAQAPA